LTFTFTDEQEEWLTSLENEVYGQHRHSVGQYNCGKPCYCCLGVANKLFAPELESVVSGNIFFDDNDADIHEKAKQKLNLRDHGNYSYDKDYVNYIISICDKKNYLTATLKLYENLIYKI